MRSELSVIGAMTQAPWIALPTTAIHAKRLIDGASTEIVSATASKDSAPIRGRGVEIDVFRKTKVPLRDAMFIAERLRDGAAAIDIGFDGTNGKPTYLVTTMQDKTVWSTVVNALTGAIEGDETSISVHELSAADRNMLQIYDKIDARLSQAVSVAEEQAKGNALGGGLSLEDGTLSFVVAVLSGERIRVVVLDPPQKPDGDAGNQGND